MACHGDGADYAVGMGSSGVIFILGLTVVVVVIGLLWMITALAGSHFQKAGTNRGRAGEEGLGASPSLSVGYARSFGPNFRLLSLAFRSETAMLTLPVESGFGRLPRE